MTTNENFQCGADGVASAPLSSSTVVIPAANVACHARKKVKRGKNDTSCSKNWERIFKESSIHIKGIQLFVLYNVETGIAHGVEVRRTLREAFPKSEMKKLLQEKTKAILEEKVKENMQNRKGS